MNIILVLYFVSCFLLHYSQNQYTQVYITQTLINSTKAGNLHYIKNSKTWDDFSNMTTRDTANIKSYMVKLTYNWTYIEDFIYYPHKRSFELLSHNDSIHSPVYKLRLSLMKMPPSLFKIIPYPDNTPSAIQDQINIVDPSKIVWYDKLAIFIIRDWSSIYHGFEWIMNFIHYAMKSEDFPRVPFMNIHKL